MKKDNVLLAEAYQKVNEGIATDAIKSIVNKFLDMVERKNPEAYKTILAADTPEKLKELLSTKKEVAQESLNEGLTDALQKVWKAIDLATSTPAVIAALGLLAGIVGTYLIASAPELTQYPGLPRDASNDPQYVAAGGYLVSAVLGPILAVLRARHQKSWTKSAASYRYEK